MPVTTRATAVQADRLMFWLPDPDAQLTAVRLWSEVPVGDDTFVRSGDGWQLDVPIPGAHRVEYLYTLHDERGSVMVTDPTNPRSVDGVFGAHSWLPMPGYSEPAWLDARRREGRLTPVGFSTSDGPVTGELWAPTDTLPSAELPVTPLVAAPTLVSVVLTWAELASTWLRVKPLVVSVTLICVAPYH